MTIRRNLARLIALLRNPVIFVLTVIQQDMARVLKMLHGRRVSAFMAGIVGVFKIRVSLNRTDGIFESDSGTGL